MASAALEPDLQNLASVSSLTVNQAAAVLEAKAPSLFAAFSPETYPATSRAMQEIESAKLREWVDRFIGPVAVDPR